MNEYACTLLVAVDAALGSWVERCVTRVAVAYHGALPEGLAEAAAVAGAEARADVVPRLRALLDADIDAQRTNPLALLRTAVRYPTAVLASAGVPPVIRDDFAERSFPDDVYGLSPATWSDVDPSLAEPGLVWGAWKAKEHLARRAEADG